MARDSRTPMVPMEPFPRSRHTLTTVHTASEVHEHLRPTFSKGNLRTVGVTVTLTRNLLKQADSKAPPWIPPSQEAAEFESLEPSLRLPGQGLEGHSLLRSTALAVNGDIEALGYLQALAPHVAAARLPVVASALLEQAEMARARPRTKNLSIQPVEALPAHSGLSEPPSDPDSAGLFLRAPL